MSGFTKVVTPATPHPDPAKRVNYTHGLVLGVDEFTQEFAWLSGRTEWLPRDLIGYGTASGLRVEVLPEVDETLGPPVVVTAGTAVSPSGRLIRVPTAQQAYINPWLDSHAQEVNRRVDSTSGSPQTGVIAVHVVLGYRACPDDERPVPGERCRTDDGPTVPSRLRDDFHLALRFDAPDQREDDASGRFVHWLTQVEITDAGKESLTLDRFLDEVRNASPFLIASPPERLRIRPRDACEYMDAAFRVWATELRPLWVRPTPVPASDCDAPPSDDDCILLATLRIPIAWSEADRGWRVDDEPRVSTDDARRPYLVHLRALQQWLLCEAERWPRLYGDVTGPPGTTTVERLRHVPIAASPPPADRQVLTFDGGTREWRPDHPFADDEFKLERTFGLTGSAGASTSFSRADHTHGTPALEGDVIIEDGKTFLKQIQGFDLFATGPTGNQLLTFHGGEQRWIPRSLTGDVTINSDGKTIVGSIQSTPIVGTGSRGHVMTFVTGPTGEPDEWRSAPLPSLGGDVTGALGNTAIQAIQGIPIVATGATGGQVMTFVTGPTGVWRPATILSPKEPPGLAFGQPGAAGSSLLLSRADHKHALPALPGLGGDMSGSLGDARIKEIQGIPVVATGPTGPGPNQVLTFDADLRQWMPKDPAGAAGSFVEHPPGEPAYAIVAAGVIHASGTPTPAPSYNGLKLVKFGTGTMILTFDGLRVPDATFQYIVKILPVSEKTPPTLSVAVGRFQLGQFEVHVTLNGTPIPTDQFGNFRFMVEVSQYGART
jgi:hypothetical protein